MTMQELQGKRVKLSRSTITVKDEEGKTQGMVRGLRRFTDMAFREQVELRGIVSPLWNNNVGLSLDNLYFDGKQGYYIHKDSFAPDWEMDIYTAKMEVLEKSKANGIKVIYVISI